MTPEKKKTAARARKPSTPPAATPAPEAKPVEAKTEAPKKITEFLWHGLARYQCSLCAADFGTEGEAYKHYHQEHVMSKPRPVVNEVDTGLVSPQGDKIVRIEEVENGEN